MTTLIESLEGNPHFGNAIYWPRRLDAEECVIVTSWNRLRDKKPISGEEIEFRCIYPDCKLDTCHGVYVQDNQVAIPGCNIPGCHLHLNPEYTWWRPRIATREADILQIDEANWWNRS